MRTRFYEDVSKLDAKTLTVPQIAKKHRVSVSAIEAELKRGIAVEREHTTDDAVAREIALDHLAERPDYYTRLKKVEESTLPTFKAFLRENERVTLDSVTVDNVTEVIPPGLETWVRENERAFKKEHGDAEGKRRLYAKAWDMYHSGKSEAANDVRIADEQWADAGSVPLRTS